MLTTNFAFNPSDPDRLLSTILSIIGHSFLLYSNLSTIPLIAAGLDRRSYFLSLDNPQEKKTLVSAASVLVECGLLHLLAQAVLFLFVVLEHPYKYAVGAAVVQIFVRRAYGITTILSDMPLCRVVRLRLGWCELDSAIPCLTLMSNLRRVS